LKEGVIQMATVLAWVRSALYALWLLLTVIPWALALLLASLVLRGTALWWVAVGWLSWAIAGARVICGVRIRVSGRENLPAGEVDPTVLLVKHQSTLETFLMPTLMPHPLAYVFKKELLQIPFFGWAMGRLDMIHIDRSQKTQAFHKVVAQGRRLLEQGVWVIMFPEGTRIARGQKGNYKSGGTRLAIETGAQVVPIAVSSAKCWPRKSFVLRPGVVDVSIGAPLASAGRQPDELMRDVERWIEAEMHRLDPEAYA
jgi:1-acyl-sn-glycerol-3-phosphate acyltransferase